MGRIGSKVAGLKLDHNLRSAAAAFAVRVGAAMLAFVIQVLLARVLDLQNYGIYVNLWAGLAIATNFAVLGFSESAIRFVPRYLKRGQYANAKGFLATGFVTVVVASLVLAGLGLVAITRFASHVSPGYAMPLTVLAFGLPFLTVELYLFGVCRSLGYFMLGIVPGYIVRPLLIGLATIAAPKVGIKVDASFVLAAAIVSTALITIAQSAIIWSRTREMFGGVKATSRTGLWLRASLPLLVVFGLDELFYWSDIMLLGVLSTPDQLGIYFAAVRSMALANFVHYALMIVSSREFSIANALKDRARLQDYVLSSARWIFWLTIPAVAVTLAFSYPLLALFGPAFVSGIPVMAVIGIGLIARAAVGNAGDLLVVLGHQKATIVIAVGALAINIALALVLVPLIGILGAAVSTAAAQIFRSLALAIAAQRLAGLNVCAVCRPARTAASGAMAV